MPATHTDKAFEQDLRDLREKLLAMGAKVEALIAGSVRALTERDSALAESVIKSDKDVNRLEVEVDDLCRRILALRQPAASDLRHHEVEPAERRLLERRELLLEGRPALGHQPNFPVT